MFKKFWTCKDRSLCQVNWTKYALLNKMSGFFKKFFLIIVILLVFYAGYLVVLLNNKPQSAYKDLITKESKHKTKLQDTRVHNWSELQKKAE